MHRWTGLRALAITLATVGLLAAASPAPTLAGTRPITFRITMGACPKGVASDRAALRVEWRDADGMLKGKGSTTAGATGSWTYCGSPTGDPSPEIVEAGDSILVVERGGVPRTFLVPRFLVRLHRQTDIADGRGPAGSRVHLRIVGPWGDMTRSVTVDTNGRFSTDLSDRIDVLGGDRVTMEMMQGDDQVRTTTQAPWIRVWRGRSVLDHEGTGGLAGLVTLETAARGSASAPVGGPAGSSRFTDRFGDPLRVQPGDKVAAPWLAGDATFVVPDIRLTVNPSTDVIVATCPAGQRYALTVFKGGTSSARFEAQGLSTGRIERDLTGRLDVVRGSLAIIDCIRPTGDRVAMRKVAD